MLMHHLRIRNWLRREEGQDLAEYALLLGLIAIVCFAAITLLGGNVSQVFADMASEVATWKFPP